MLQKLSEFHGVLWASERSSASLWLQRSDWGTQDRGRILLFSFAPLLAVEIHWQVQSLLQLVVLLFEPAEGLGPVLCDWAEKAALPRGLGWINSWRSGPGEFLCVGWDSIDVWNISSLRVWMLPWWQPSPKKCLYEGEILMCIKSCGCAVTLRKCLHLSIVPGSCLQLLSILPETIHQPHEYCHHHLCSKNHELNKRQDRINQPLTSADFLRFCCWLFNCIMSIF